MVPPVKMAMSLALVSNLFPARGRKLNTAPFLKLFPLRSFKPLPRKGTETIIVYVFPGRYQAKT